MLGMQDPTMTSLHSKHSISVGGVGWGRTPSGITHCSTYHSHEFPSTSFIRQFFFAVAERHYGTQPTVQHNVDTVGLFSLSVKWRKTFVRKQEILWGEKTRKKRRGMSQSIRDWMSERAIKWVSEWVSERASEGRPKNKEEPKKWHRRGRQENRAERLTCTQLCQLPRASNPEQSQFAAGMATDVWWENTPHSIQHEAADA